MPSFYRTIGRRFIRISFAFLVLVSLVAEVQAQTATGTLTTNSPCYLPGPESVSRCTINFTITKQNTPIACLWNTGPTQLVSCEGHASWSGPWGWATTAPRTLELRAYNTWPANTEAARQAGKLLAQKTVVAKMPTGTLTSSNPCSLPGPQSPTLCTVTLNVTRQNVPISCLWILEPARVVHCGSAASWSQSWIYTSLTPRLFELRGHATYPESNATGHAAGVLLATRTIVAASPTGTLTTDSPCYLPGPESASRCTINLTMTKQNTPAACLWNTGPTQLVSCEGLASWSAPWVWATTTPRRLELRAYTTLPPNTEAGRQAGRLLAQKTVVAKLPTGTLTTDSPCSLPGPVSGELCTVKLNVTRQNVPISCLWIIEPISAVHCGPLASWSQPWAYTSTTPRVIELRGHATYPESNDAAGRAEGVLLAKQTVVANLSTPPSPPTGTLTTSSPCSLPGPESASLCTVTLNVTRHNVPISCLWITEEPARVVHCGPLTSWSHPWVYTSTTPRVIELRGHTTYPESNAAGRTEGILLAQQTVVATGTGSNSSTPSVPSPAAPVLASAPTPSSTIDQARALAGEFNVTSGGQASYTIPILTAPGSAGLAPDISIIYNSGGSNGVMGLGWSLNAGGSISRCRQTEGHDKNASPITWSTQDRFCLNGERLLVVTGQYGEPGSTYKTEIDNLARVTAVGGSAGHPDSFRVEHKDGTVETYGNTSDSVNSQYRLSSSDSKTVLNWSLSRRSDSAGNKILFRYISDADGQRLDTIDYAFGSSSTRGAYIRFDYENRGDPITGYVAGHAYKTGKRLKTIISFNGSQEIRKYHLTFNLGSAFTTNDNLSRINKIEECVNSTCSPATEFEWSIFSPTINSAGSSSTFQGGASDYTFGDVNGDGLTDLIWYEEAKAIPNQLHDELQKRAYRYALGRQDHLGMYSFDTQNSFRSAANYDDRNLHVVDKNNDGKMDIFAGGTRGVSDFYLDVDGDGLIDKLQWYEGVPPWVPYYHHIQSVYYSFPKAGVDPSSNDYYHFSRGPLRQRFDSTAHIPSEANASRWEDLEYYRGSLTGGEPELDNMQLAPIAFLWPLTGDFNGSGRLDIVADTYTILSGCTDDGNEEGCSSTFSHPSIYTTHKPAPSQAETSFPGLELKYFNKQVGYMASRAFVEDLNGDGLSDMIVGTGAYWYFRINNGTELGPEQYLDVPGAPFATTDKIATDVAIADYNGDGYPDFIWHSPTPPFTSTTVGAGNGLIKVKYWNPALNNFDEQEHIIKSQPYEVLTNYGDARYGWNFSFNRFKTSAIKMMDVNGDGKIDLITTPTRQTGAVNVNLNVGEDKPHNKIISIQGGLDEHISVQYESIMDSEHYVGGDKIHETGSPEQCAQVADPTGEYTESMCWDTSGPTTESEFYRNINDPWGTLSAEHQSLKPTSPIFHKMGPMYVVTGTAHSSPTATNQSAKRRKAYFYEQARMQASGRGFLGFEIFTSVDRETGLREKTQFRQDWPFVGKPKRTEVFNSGGNILNTTENIWGLTQCYSNGNSNSACVENLGQTLKTLGSAALGPIQIFLPKSNIKSYALENGGVTQGILLNETETIRTTDDKGNVLEENVTVSGSTPGGVNKVSTSQYIYTGNTWSMQQGRLQRLSVTSSNANYGAVTRVSSFDYHTSGTSIGLLKTETVEPDNAEFTVSTTHSYTLGNRTKSSTTADGQTRITEVAYDAAGRYIDSTYELFTNGTNPDGGIRKLASQVVNRDRYGTPLDVRRYTGSTTYVIERIATTAFGTPYFKANSTGAQSIINRGFDGDPYGVCISGTKIWTHTQDVTGAKTIECADLLGRVIRTGVVSFDGASWSVVDTEYDKLGRALRISTPHFRNSQAHWAEHEYDDLGRVTLTQQPYNGTTIVTHTEYDGYNTRVTNAKGRVRVETRDPLGQIVEVRDPLMGLTEFKYDARGNLRKMKDPANNPTDIGYDLRDRKISMSDPDKGNWIYRYNRFGEVICQQDGKNQTSVQRYDIRGRLFSRTNRLAGGTCNNPTGTLEKYSQWTYDTAAYGLGQLTRVHDSASVDGNAQYQQSYVYDAFARVSNTTTTMPGINNVTGHHYEKFTYDAYGRPFQVFDAARATEDFNTNGIQHIYNTSGYLQSVVDAVKYGSTQQPYYTVNEMDARGNVVSAEYGNGVTQQGTFYPETGLAKSLRADALISSAPMQRIELEWDEVGNLEWRHENGTAGTNTARNIREVFDYDDLNRLEVWTTSGDINLAESVSYNNIDNILSKSGVGNYLYGAQCSASANAGPHAVCRAGNTNYAYDNNGNMLTDSSGRQLKYTSYDLPNEITKGSTHKTTFSYGPNRSRYKRVDIAQGVTTTTLYVGSVEKVFYPSNIIEWKRSIAGVALITQRVNSSGTKLSEAQRYLLKDHLGSLSLITDEIGGVEQVTYFDPWGQARKIVTSSSTKQWLDEKPFTITNKPITTRGYTGHEHMDEVGLIHMNGRIYDGKLARFVQADPIIQDPLRVQSLNRYSYVWNNPLNATDPSGFCTENEITSCPAPSSEQVEEVVTTGKKNIEPPRDSGFRYTITDPAAVKQYMDNLGKDFKDFDAMMQGMGISKASTSNSAGKNSGSIFAAKKGNVAVLEFESKNSRTVIYADGTASESAADALGDENAQEREGFRIENGALVDAHNQLIYDQNGNPMVVAMGMTPNPKLLLAAAAIHGKKGFNVLKTAFGKGNPTKPGANGKPQPYDAKTGRYLSPEANPGLIHSPAGRFGAGFTQGLAEAKTGAQGATPVGTAGNIGHMIGTILGNIF